MTSVRAIFEARDHMLADGYVPERLSRAVKPTILQSWKRSILSGFDPGAPALQYYGDVQGHASLRAAADPVLTELAQRLSRDEALRAAPRDRIGHRHAGAQDAVSGCDAHWVRV